MRISNRGLLKGRLGERDGDGTFPAKGEKGKRGLCFGTDQCPQRVTPVLAEGNSRCDVTLCDDVLERPAARGCARVVSAPREARSLREREPACHLRSGVLGGRPSPPSGIWRPAGGSASPRPFLEHICCPLQPGAPSPSGRPPQVSCGIGQLARIGSDCREPRLVQTRVGRRSERTEPPHAARRRDRLPPLSALGGSRPALAIPGGASTGTLSVALADSRLVASPPGPSTTRELSYTVQSEKNINSRP